MRTIALTGGIASGKSTVAQVFEELGATVVDADVLAREVVDIGTPGLTRVRAEFGDEVVSSDGSLNRVRLGEIVFGDAVARARLNGIVHPLVREAYLKAHREAELSGVEIFVYGVPLLVETRAPLDGFDSIVVTSAPEDVRVDRLIRLRSLDAGQATARVAAGAAESARLAVADFVIDTGGTIEATIEQAREVYAKIAA